MVTKVQTNFDEITKFDNYTIKSASPAGTIYLHFLEFNGRLMRIMSSTGKAGTEFNVFVNGICNLVNELLKNGVSYVNVMSSISGMSTDKSTKDGPIDVRSGIDGIYNAMQKYNKLKFEEVRVKNEPRYFKRMDERA